MRFIEKLKSRWGLKNALQVVIVLIVFACTGFTVLFIKKPLFYMVGLDESSDSWYRTLIYLIMILPAYQILLLMYGFVFGQFSFFWEFEKKTFARIGRLFAGRNKTE